MTTSDLTPVGQLDLTPMLAIVAGACAALAVILIVAVVLLSRPRKTRAKAQPRGAHTGAADRRAWHRRIDEVVSRHDSGELDREEALDRKSTRLNSSHRSLSRMPSSA